MFFRPYQSIHNKDLGLQISVFQRVMVSSLLIVTYPTNEIDLHYIIIAATCAGIEYCGQA